MGKIMPGGNLLQWGGTNSEDFRVTPLRKYNIAEVFHRARFIPYFQIHEIIRFSQLMENWNNPIRHDIFYVNVREEFPNRHSRSAFRREPGVFVV